MTESIATSSVPASVPATTTKPQPTFEAHIPQFAPIKHPLRFAINGKKHMVSNLKDLVTGIAEIPDHYKAVIHAELNNLKSNAAEIDLHVVDHANGDISIQAHIKPIQLG